MKGLYHNGSMHISFMFCVVFIFCFVGALVAEEGGAVERGKALYTTKACVACHSLDGAQVVGPTFKGLYGKSGEHNEGTYVANDEYLTESIKDPNAKIVKGFQPAMPPVPLSDEEVSDLIEFIKSVK